MERRKVRTLNAYLTVEAALVMPIVIGTLLFIVYMLLFQYNRCLTEQDLGAMALWGGTVEETESQTLEQMTRERMAGLYREKYAAWQFTKLEAGLKNNSFRVTGEAQLQFPFAGWNFWGGDTIWSTEAEYEYRRFSPVTFIRLCRGLQSLKTEDKGE